MTDHPIRQTPDELREQAETDMHVVLPAEPEQDDTPSRRAGLRGEIARAIHRYDYDHLLSGNDIPSEHHRGEADAVLALLYREWPWLRAEAEDATGAPCGHVSPETLLTSPPVACTRHAGHEDHADERGIRWRSAPDAVPRFTAHPVTPEMEHAATARAVQAAADSEKTATWLAANGGILTAPAATEATEPATITDPAWLRQQYAEAIRDHGLMHPDGRVFNGSHDCCADAVLNVRDRHVLQLRQRLQLADRLHGQHTATILRIQALADEHPAGIDTALVLEALDQQQTG